MMASKSFGSCLKKRESERRSTVSRKRIRSVRRPLVLPISGCSTFSVGITCEKITSMHICMNLVYCHSPCQPNMHAGSQTPHFAGREANGEPTWNMADVFKGKGVEGFKERTEAAATAKLTFPDSNKYSQAIFNPIIRA